MLNEHLIYGRLTNQIWVCACGVILLNFQSSTFTFESKNRILRSLGTLDLSVQNHEEFQKNNSTKRPFDFVYTLHFYFTLLYIYFTFFISICSQINFCSHGLEGVGLSLSCPEFTIYRVISRVSFSLQNLEISYWNITFFLSILPKYCYFLKKRWRNMKVVLWYIGNMGIV